MAGTVLGKRIRVNTSTAGTISRSFLTPGYLLIVNKQSQVVESVFVADFKTMRMLHQSMMAISNKMKGLWKSMEVPWTKIPTLHRGSLFPQLEATRTAILLSESSHPKRLVTAMHYQRKRR